MAAEVALVALAQGNLGQENKRHGHSDSCEKFKHASGLLNRCKGTNYVGNFKIRPQLPRKLLTEIQIHWPMRNMYSKRSAKPPGVT